MDETRAIELCKEGELQHFSVLYEVYFDKIYNFLYFRTLHKEIAEDLTSKTFIKALEKVQTFDKEKGKFSTWIFRIARNTLFDHFRTKKEALDIDEIWEIGERDKTEDNIDTRDEVKKVEEQIRELSEDEQEVVRMRIWEDRSYKEIGEILKKSEGAAKMAFSRAIKKLRTKIHESLTLEK